jgi:hypothetical protein
VQASTKIQTTHPVGGERVHSRQTANGLHTTPHFSPWVIHNTAWPREQKEQRSVADPSIILGTTPRSFVRACVVACCLVIKGSFSRVSYCDPAQTGR